VAQALYRKYRPRTFAEVIGQEHVTEPLMQALRTGRLNHAYLFSGPRGCGKTSSARILARSLNCEKGPTPEPCGACDSCVALAPDGAGSIDVIEIDAASHGGVDDARDLRERAFFAPAASRFKVYIIDEAHMVSSAGFNALLKLVEEPPDFVKFVFATTEPEKVLGTIKSRTHHYPFRLIPPGVLRPYLETLCESEGATVEPLVFPLVVRAGGGSARDSLSVLDQLIAGAGPEGVTYRRAVALLGVTDVALIDDMCDALAAGDGATAYTTIDRVAEAGHDPRRFASDLLERLRDLMILQQVPDAVGKGILDGADDELARMSLQAQRFGAATLSRMADIVHNGLTEMRGTTAPRLLLELVVARMLLPGADDSTSALLQRLERMERRMSVGVDPVADAASLSAAPPLTPPPVAAVPPAPAPSAAPAPPAAPAPSAAQASTSSPASAESSSVAAPGSAEPAPAAPPPAVEPAPTPGSTPVGGTPGAVDAATVRRCWDEILANVRRRKPRAAAVLKEASVRDVDGDTLVLLFKHTFHANSVTSDPQYLLDAVHEVLAGRWQVRCEISGQASGPAVDSPRSQAAPAAGAEVTRLEAPPQEASTPVAEADDSGWPTPARPGGGAAPDPAGDDSGRPSTGDGATQAGPDGGRARSETATITAPATTTGAAQAGAPARSGAVNSGPASGGAVGPRPDQRGAGGARPASGGTGNGSGASSARAAARAAASGKSGSARAKGAAGRNGPVAPRQGGADSGWSDAPPPDEPPYDPDYDPPVRDGRAGYEGFDPGDEPLDDDEQSVRQTSEQQALQLLQQALGAEKIDEVDARRQP
jgi:DNA polymerase-3 subunit gamma/tau